jgi:O-antigen ligase
VFTQPWDTIAWESVGALSRIVGLGTFGAAVVAIALERRLRRPSAILWLALAFVASTGLSLLWTESDRLAVVRVFTYGQLVVSVWMLQEFVRTREHVESLLYAFCLGSFVPAADLLNNFRHGISDSPYAERYTSDGALALNPDNLALTLAIAIPMALYLTSHRRGIVRIVAMIYVVVGSIGVLLTGTRGVFLALIAALSVGVLTHILDMLRRIVRPAFRLRGIVLLICVTVAITYVVPASIWERILSITTELTGGGNMSGRVDIWNAGVQAFMEHPFIGVGAAGFGGATFFGQFAAAHNMPLEVLVEQGVIGFCFFAGLLGACGLAVIRLPTPERKLWTALMVCWFVGVLSLNYGASKPTWLLFGLLAAQASGDIRRRPVDRRESLNSRIDTGRIVAGGTVFIRAGR